MLLAILAFSLSLLGTFLRALRRAHLGARLRRPTRRAASSSSPSSASSSAARSRCSPSAPARCAPGGLFAPISREGALVLNNLFLTAACAAAVVVGTLYPLVLEALTGERISVGAPFFNLHLRPAGPAAPHPRAVRADACLEARRPPRRGRAADVRVRRGIARGDPRGAGCAGGAVGAGAVRRLARLLADRRRALEDRLPREARCTAPSGESRRRRGWPAALGLRHRACPCRRRRHGARHRRRHDLGDGSHPVACKPGGDRRHRRLRRSTLDGVYRRATVRTTARRVVRFTVRDGGSVGRGHGADQARSSPRAQTATTEAGIATFGVLAALRLARRHRRRRRRGRAHLLEAAGDAASGSGRWSWRSAGSCRSATGRLRVGAPRPARTRRCRCRRNERRARLAVAAWPAGARRSPAAALWPYSPTRCSSDPALEARARTLSTELRCMVCQNQSIDDSDAPLAARPPRAAPRADRAPATATPRCWIFSSPATASSSC